MLKIFFQECENEVLVSILLIPKIFSEFQIFFIFCFVNCADTGCQQANQSQEYLTISSKFNSSHVIE